MRGRPPSRSRSTMRRRCVQRWPMADIACVLAEPVMTNCGMILPQPGFLRMLRELTRGPRNTAAHRRDAHHLDRARRLLDGARTRARYLRARKTRWRRRARQRLGTLGRCRASLRAALRRANTHGHSGIGTTLSGSALQLACLRACLEEVMTPAAYATMLVGRRTHRDRTDQRRLRRQVFPGT